MGGQGYYWYDGVVGLTQCGIDPNQSFTYSFIASEVGIRWFHGHSSGVKLDGLYGAFIVHPKMSKPEETHVVLIADSISSSVHGANSPLKLGSNIFEHGSAELNLKEEDKIWTNENMEL